MKPLYKYILFTIILTSTLACSKVTYEEVAGKTYSNLHHHFILPYLGHYQTFDLLYFDKDSTFEYGYWGCFPYYSSAGTWKIIDGNIIFISDTMANISAQYSDRVNGYRLVFKDDYDSIVPYVNIFYYSNTKQHVTSANEQGVAYIDSKVNIDSFTVSAAGFRNFNYTLTDTTTNFFDIKLKFHTSGTFIDFTNAKVKTRRNRIKIKHHDGTIRVKRYPRTRQSY